jgi:hypothetical protein
MSFRFYFTQKVSLINLLNKNPNEKVFKMYRITSMFSQQESFRLKPHSGIDFKMEIGEPIRSIKDGIVTVKDFGNVNAGKTVLVKWEDGNTSIYGHLNDFAVKTGQHVKTGDLLGHAGNTGFSTGSHLHFGLKNGAGQFIDPSPYLDNIQNMNTNVAQHIPEVTQVKLNFFDYMNQHMNVLSDLKMHLIHLPYDTLLIQISKQLLQFISVHASFLQSIVTHIF